MAQSYPSHPLVGVCAVIIDGRRLVMCRRAKPPRRGGWALPGGDQELGETVEAAAVREAGEETGLTIETLGLVDILDTIVKDDNGDIQYHYTLIFLAAQAVSGALRAGDDAAEAIWVTLDELRTLDTWRTTVDIAEKAFALYGEEI